MNDLNYYGYDFIRESDLAHHGIKGQKWGQRRFQNEDGTWTAAGKERYGDGESTGSGSGSVRSFKGNLHRALAANYGLNAKVHSKSNKTLASINKQAQNAQLKKAAEADAAKAKKMNDPKHQKKVANAKKALKIGAAVAGTALAAYGGYKLYQHGVKVKNAKAAAAEAEYIRQKSEAGRRMYNEALRKMMASNDGGGTFSMRIADGSVLSTTWGPKKK